MEIRLTLKTWAMIRYLQSKTPTTEVGMMGILNPEDYSLVEDLWVPKQEVSSASVDFDDDGMALATNELDERGEDLERWTSVWIHTHPGNSCTPSGIDESTWTNVFGRRTWAVMMIVGRGGDVYIRTRVVTPGGKRRPVLVGSREIKLADVFRDLIQLENVLDGETANNLDGFLKNNVSEKKWGGGGGYRPGGGVIAVGNNYEDWRKDGWVQDPKTGTWSKRLPGEEGDPKGSDPLKAVRTTTSSGGTATTDDPTDAPEGDVSLSNRAAFIIAMRAELQYQPPEPEEANGDSTE